MLPLKSSLPGRATRPSSALRLVLSAFRANGFSSTQEMNQAHEIVLAALRLSPPTSVLDLGAGNGHLMDRIASEFNCRARGIEIDVERAGAHEDIIIADLADTGNLPLGFDTLLVSKNRFGEIPELEQWCRDSARQTIVYSYDEPQSASVL